jgi:hypothetical protein
MYMTLARGSRMRIKKVGTWFAASSASVNTSEKRLRMRGNKKDGEEFKCKIINKNMAI